MNCSYNATFLHIEKECRWSAIIHLQYGTVLLLLRPRMFLFLLGLVFWYLCCTVPLYPSVIYTMYYLYIQLFLGAREGPYHIPLGVETSQMLLLLILLVLVCLTLWSLFGVVVLFALGGSLVVEGYPCNVCRISMRKASVYCSLVLKLLYPHIFFVLFGIACKKYYTQPFGILLEGQKCCVELFYNTLMLGQSYVGLLWMHNIFVLRNTKIHNLSE